MSNNGIVKIHGKDYVTVAQRVKDAHADKELQSVETEILNHNPVVVKATVKIKGKVFTGISAVILDEATSIERDNPYEVAETSAVGRALGFAGYGIVDSIATADEMFKAGATQAPKPETPTKELEVTCETCGKLAIEKKGITKGGKPYHGIFCTSEDRSHTRWLWS